MKNLITLFAFTLLLISCKKQVIDRPAAAPEKHAKTDCRDMFKSYDTTCVRTWAKPPFTLNATPLSSTTVKLSWKKQGRQTFDIYRDSVLILSAYTGTSYTDTGLMPSTLYTYTVNGASATVRTLEPFVPPTNSANVLLLDVDGHLVTGTSWNSNGDFYVDPSGLSNEEVQIVLSGIRSAFSPFSLMVTTDESIYEAADPSNRQREIITPTYQWFGAAGGVAFLNSFGTAIGSTGQPCFVFSSLLAYRTKDIIFAGAHEAGHTLGLFHAADYCGQAYSTGPWFMGGNYQQLSYGWQASGLDSRCEIVCEPCVINQTLNQ